MNYKLYNNLNKNSINTKLIKQRKKKKNENDGYL